MKTNSSYSIDTRIIDSVFLLIKVAIGTCSPSQITKQFSEVEWEEIYQESLRQTVSGLCYLGIRKLPEHLLPPLKILKKWIATVNLIRESNLCQQNSIIKILDILHTGGTYPILMKGQKFAIMYDQPLYRQCGDIDLFFKSDYDYLKAITFLNKKGFKINKNYDNSATLIFNNSVVDLHNSLPSGIDSSDYIWEDMLISCAYHILKHAVTFGIGLRQLCDLSMMCKYLHHYYSPINEDSILLESFRKKLIKGDILEWWNNLELFLIDYLDVPQEWLPFKGKLKGDSKPIFRIISTCGNFGLHTEHSKIISLIRNLSGLIYQSPKTVFRIYLNYLVKKLQFKIDETLHL